MKLALVLCVTVAVVAVVGGHRGLDSRVEDLVKKYNLDVIPQRLNNFERDIIGYDEGNPRGKQLDKAVAEAEYIYDRLIAVVTSINDLVSVDNVMDLLRLAQVNHVTNRIRESLASGNGDMQQLVNAISCAYKWQPHGPAKYSVGAALDVLYSRNVNSHELRNLILGLCPIIEIKDEN
ncbi:unnamed protein product [Bursaphelenchus okinawaensis]|uniref:Uncharacterized protein n=1 Tax=Bursaphelenchus okinawaensis TaxID=465554 RepID=A0A811K237_9BILA|nr:unnamed protein product [Bursaphelenchus okinawaensis]CAG9089576.1 unnamed protein product [Bursaphelenchus okinawaensis]